MGHEKKSSTERDDEQEETVEPAPAEGGERPPEAAVNSAVALRLLRDRGDGDGDTDTDDSDARKRREDGEPGARAS